MYFSHPKVHYFKSQYFKYHWNILSNPTLYVLTFTIETLLFGNLPSSFTPSWCFVAPACCAFLPWLHPGSFISCVDGFQADVLLSLCALTLLSCHFCRKQRKDGSESYTPAFPTTTHTTGLQLKGGQMIPEPWAHLSITLCFLTFAKTLADFETPFPLDAKEKSSPVPSENVRLTFFWLYKLHTTGIQRASDGVSVCYLGFG